jgi:hypothetical protein
MFANYPDIYCIFSLAKSHTVPHYLDSDCRYGRITEDGGNGENERQGRKNQKLGFHRDAGDGAAPGLYLQVARMKAGGLTKSWV